MIERTGRRTVPQIYIGERHVGGYDDLVVLDRAGELAPLLGRGRRSAGAARRRCAIIIRLPPGEFAWPTPKLNRTLSIEKIYVKDLSLENPGAPQSFTTTEAPQVEVGLRTRGEQIEENVYECVLTITVTAKTADKTLFLVEAAQAGIFRIVGVPLADIQPLIGDPLPDRAVSLHPRNDRRRGYTRRLSACASRPDQFRGAVPAADRQHAAAGARGAGDELAGDETR